eukprot:COSAG06_NODE_4962_length_3827_cov_3.210032_1_plen_327_part_00
MRSLCRCAREVESVHESITARNEPRVQQVLARGVSEPTLKLDSVVTCKQTGAEVVGALGSVIATGGADAPAVGALAAADAGELGLGAAEAGEGAAEAGEAGQGAARALEDAPRPSAPPAGSVPRGPFTQDPPIEDAPRAPAIEDAPRGAPQEPLALEDGATQSTRVPVRYLDDTQDLRGLDETSVPRGMPSMTPESMPRVPSSVLDPAVRDAGQLVTRSAARDVGDADDIPDPIPEADDDFGPDDDDPIPEEEPPRARPAPRGAAPRDFGAPGPGGMSGVRAAARAARAASGARFNSVMVVGVSRPRTCSARSLCACRGRSHRRKR